MPRPLTSLPIETTIVTTSDPSVIVVGDDSAVPTNNATSYHTTTRQFLVCEGPVSLPIQQLVIDQSNFTLPEPRVAELNSAYKDVGLALADMSDPADEDLIDSAVYSVARSLAQSLMSSRYPAPKLFTHGRKSVVFNWAHGSDSLYLTVSADHISALISSSDRIERRLEFSLNNLLSPSYVFPAIESAQTQRQIVIRGNTVELIP
jgi:hypothetical protein